jgi:uncharacterized protein YggE
MTALYRAALRAAIANAKGKAQTIAAASGLHLRRITDVARRAAHRCAAAHEAGADAATPVEPGTQLVEAAVTVTFAIG